jgi:hypothetical protein
VRVCAAREFSKDAVLELKSPHFIVETVTRDTKGLRRIRDVAHAMPLKFCKLEKTLRPNPLPRARPSAATRPRLPGRGDI